MSELDSVLSAKPPYRMSKREDYLHTLAIIIDAIEYNMSKLHRNRRHMINDNYTEEIVEIDKNKDDSVLEKMKIIRQFLIDKRNLKFICFRKAIALFKKINFAYRFINFNSAPVNIKNVYFFIGNNGKAIIENEALVDFMSFLFLLNQLHKFCVNC